MNEVLSWLQQVPPARGFRVQGRSSSPDEVNVQDMHLRAGQEDTREVSPARGKDTVPLERHPHVLGVARKCRWCGATLVGKHTKFCGIICNRKYHNLMKERS